MAVSQVTHGEFGSARTTWGYTDPKWYDPTVHPLEGRVRICSSADEHR